MKRLKRIWRYVNRYSGQPSMAKESYLPMSRTKATTEFPLIPNPYIAGIPLRLSDTRFVGRQEIALQIEDTLENTKHPTFFLSGERRIGKSSFLQQLPTLLREQYIPVICDLQNVAFRFTITHFLANIAWNIYQAVSVRGFCVPMLTNDNLLEASKESEFMVFCCFEQWLNRVVQVFDRNIRSILIAFDEYEMLVWRDNPDLNLELLFSWFHKITQSNSCLIFLFCGVTPVSDIDNKEMFYFNNIQSLKISFLHPTEARQLILRPIPDFPSEEIFGEDIVEEIIRVIGCHPFLIQCLCLELIECLNMKNRSQVQFEDITSALENLFESWGSTYFADLWARTSKEERLCLFILNNQGMGDQLEIQQRTGLDEQVVHHTIQGLLRRDLLVVLENGSYRIVTPIFSKWVETQSHSMM